MRRKPVTCEALRAAMAESVTMKPIGECRVDDRVGTRFRCPKGHERDVPKFGDWNGDSVCPDCRAEAKR